VLAQSCQKALDELNVTVRMGRVTEVREGRPSSNRSIGKQVTIEVGKGVMLQEDTDLVLWTAGAHLLCLCVRHKLL
jgi:hypothetical protein